MALVAARALNAGEEVTIDYGYLHVARFAAKYGFAISGHPVLLRYPPPEYARGHEAGPESASFRRKKRSEVPYEHIG